jgi:hypothetical protein
MGAAYGSAGERCMAISVAVPVGDPPHNAIDLIGSNRGHATTDTDIRWSWPFEASHWRVLLWESRLQLSG